MSHGQKMQLPLWTMAKIREPPVFFGWKSSESLVSFPLEIDDLEIAKLLLSSPRKLPQHSQLLGKKSTGDPGTEYSHRSLYIGCLKSKIGSY